MEEGKWYQENGTPKQQIRESEYWIVRLNPDLGSYSNLTPKQAEKIAEIMNNPDYK